VVSFNQIQGDSNMLSVSRLTFPAGRLHFPKERSRFDLSLYLVANKPSFQDDHLFFSKILEAVRGGVSCVQLRDHKSEYPASLKIARRLKEMLGKTPLFINTLESIKVAQSIEAEGVYLEEGVSYSQARNLLGEKVIIGIPVKNMSEVFAAGQTNIIDYLSVKVSPSKRTCPKNNILWGVEGLREIRKQSPHRIVAIGGLNLESVDSIYRDLHSDDGIAMAGGLMAEDDPYLTAQKIQAILKKIRREV
jgi:thiamine-phosphate diphosphorylase